MSDFDFDWLVSLWPKDATGNEVEFGLFNGAFDESFVIDGAPRLFRGNPGQVSIGQLVYSAELVVQEQSVGLALNDEVRAISMGYNLKAARAEIHLLRRDPQRGNVLDITRRFKGFVDTAPTTLGAQGAQISLGLVTAVRQGTSLPGRRKSDAAQTARHAGDRFLQYVESTAENDSWG